MDASNLSVFDWHRLFIGDLTPWFLAEVAFRTVFMFGWLLLMIRWIGKRGAGQFSILELSIIVALGSAAGDPMFYPEVPLLHAMLVISLVVLMQRCMSYWIIRSEQVETFLEGRPIELVCHGVIQHDGLQQARLSLEDVFESLRVAGVRQLGQVSRAYMEQNGQISVLSLAITDHPPIGLPVVPPWDIECPIDVDTAQASALTPLACLHCGAIMLTAKTACGTCQHTDMTWAVRDPLNEIKSDKTSTC